MLTYGGDVDLKAKPLEWDRSDNLTKPHGAHSGKTPHEALKEKQWSSKPVSRPIAQVTGGKPMVLRHHFPPGGRERYTYQSVRGIAAWPSETVVPTARNCAVPVAMAFM